MAVLTGPLMSLGARGKLASTLVFFPWKGLNVARQYVVPTNPRTALQTTQRGILSDAVDKVHAAQAAAANPLDEADKTAYSLLASLVKKSTTWFNQACKNYIDCVVAGNTGTVFRDGGATPGSGELDCEIYSDEVDATNITAAHIFWGTSPSALLESHAATVTSGSNKLDYTIPSLVAGVKYYFQFRVDTGENCEGAVSGIYHGVPTT
jgi:hypothetical protein